ncbi:MAG: hypothetical protein J4G13_15525, partial [Dehalococcoidia bacterium]|nr:hypothetical protein [Dehalococcoidia bacterium]
EARPAAGAEVAPGIDPGSCRSPGVPRLSKEQHDLIGRDIFCARHLFGYISPEAANQSIRLFAQEVMPAFN